MPAVLGHFWQETLLTIPDSGSIQICYYSFKKKIIWKIFLRHHLFSSKYIIKINKFTYVLFHKYLLIYGKGNVGRNHYLKLYLKYRRKRLTIDLYIYHYLFLLDIGIPGYAL